MEISSQVFHSTLKVQKSVKWKERPKTSSGNNKIFPYNLTLWEWAVKIIL